jgi:hypothetical protein
MFVTFKMFCTVVEHVNCRGGQRYEYKNTSNSFEWRAENLFSEVIHSVFDVYDTKSLYVA